MLKKLSLFSAALLCLFATARAQQNVNHAPASLRQVLTNGASSKTTATASRLVAVTNRYMQNGNLDLYDSTRCYYPSGYGYDLLLDEWKFDNAKSWEHDGSSYVDEYIVTHTFDANGRTETTKYEFYDNGQWNTEGYETYTYDANGNVATTLDAYNNGTTWDSTRGTLTYNPQGKVTLQLNEDYNTVTMMWEPMRRTTLTYNANGDMLTSTTEVWNMGQWQNSYRVANTYVNNLLSESLNEVWFSGMWHNSNKEIFSYDANGNLTQNLNDYWNAGQWEPGQRITHTYNANNDKTSTTYENYGSGNYEYQNRVLYDNYNTYHQEGIETNETWNATLGQFEMQDGDEETRYYYEEYSQSVKDSKGAVAGMHIYPNPARGMLKVSATFDEAVVASLTMLDMNGRTVKQTMLPAVRQQNTTINISNLPAGTYLLQMNANGKMQMQKVVISE